MVKEKRVLIYFILSQILVTCTLLDPIRNFHVATLSMSNSVSKCLCCISHVSDVNECMEGISQCNQTCVNIIGSYYCTCERGFQRYNSIECAGENVFCCTTASFSGTFEQLCAYV